jgi:hypothetical protein
VLCIPIEYRSDTARFEVCCVDGRAGTVPLHRLAIWSTKFPLSATLDALANAEDAQVLSLMRDGCIVNDSDEISKHCIARCLDLLTAAPTSRRMLNGGADEFLVSAIPALTFKPVSIALLLNVLCHIFAAPLVLPVEARLEMRLRAVQADLPAHLAELLWMHMPEDLECAVMECASRLLCRHTRCCSYVSDSLSPVVLSRVVLSESLNPAMKLSQTH